MRAAIASSVLLLGAIALAGCAAQARVEFTAPRVMMHLEGKVAGIERIHGQPTIEKIDRATYRIDGTGEVRINEFHLVQIAPNKIRLHGVDVPSSGQLRHVFVEKDKAIDGVHLDRVKK